MFKTFILVCLLLLQACGSGGTPSTLGQITFTEGGAYIAPLVMNSNLIATPVTEADPNKSVTSSSGSTYDLSRSSPDGNGASYSNAYFNGSWKPSTHLKLWGQTLTAPCAYADYTTCQPATLDKPHQDVIDALHQGWTGKGVNILIEDFLSGDDFYHGITTGLIASRNAPGANLYGLDLKNPFTVFDNQLGAIPAEGYSTEIKLGVVNASYGADLKKLIGKPGPWTDGELLQARTDYVGSATLRSNKYNDSGKSGDLLKFKYSDAVIVQAAGNDKIKADQDPSSWYLSRDLGIKPRLLIVGSVSSNGSTDQPTSISSYSNTAGSDPDVQGRFLVAYDSTPYGDGNVAFNGKPLNSGVGTSYAAPRVSAYVAIVRSKFPNLNATNTASILLDTARYDTLACSKNGGTCDPAIYGKGEASLSRALAPVGKLR